MESRAARDGADDQTDAEQGHHGLTGTRLRSRRSTLVVSAIALGVAAIAGAGLALMPSAPAPKTSLSEAPAPAQSNARPPVGESDGVSRDVNVPVLKDGPDPDHAQVGRPDVDVTGSSAKPSAPFEVQRPGDNSTPAAPPAGAPSPAAPAVGASTASQAPRPDPAVSGPVKPTDTPAATTPPASAEPTTPIKAPRPHDSAARTAGVGADSARPPTRPGAGKAPAQKIVAKGEKAKAGAAAGTPYPPRRLAQPKKAVEAATAEATPAPADAGPIAPAPPASFAAQSVGQITHAFDYLTHLPAALIHNSAAPSPEAK